MKAENEIKREPVCMSFPPLTLGDLFMWKNIKAIKLLTTSLCAQSENCANRSSYMFILNSNKSIKYFSDATSNCRNYV